MPSKSHKRSNKDNNRSKPVRKTRKPHLDVYEASDPEEDERRMLSRRAHGFVKSIQDIAKEIGTVDYHVDHIDDEDDEEVDEDEAFDENDEEKYGMFFKQSSKVCIGYL